MKMNRKPVPKAADISDASDSEDQEMSESKPQSRESCSPPSGRPLWQERGYPRPPRRRINDPPVVLSPPTAPEFHFPAPVTIADSYEEDDDDESDEKEQRPLIMETVEHDEPEQNNKSEHDLSHSSPAELTPSTGTPSPERARSASPFKSIAKELLARSSRAPSVRSERSMSSESDRPYSVASRSHSLAPDVEEEQDQAVPTLGQAGPVSDVEPELRNDEDEIAGADQAAHQPVEMKTTGIRRRYVVCSFAMGVLLAVLAVVCKLTLEKQWTTVWKKWNL